VTTTNDVVGGATHVTPAMQQVVGTQISRTVSHPVSPSDIRRWAVAVYYPRAAPQRYLRPRTVSDGELIAPEEFNPFAWTTAESDGIDLTAEMSSGNTDCIEQSLGVAGPGLATVLNGELQIEYGAPIRSGDVITALTALDGYAERQTSRGTMLVTTIRSTWTNQRGELVKATRNAIIRY
jgi:hypothetical protein